MIKRNKNIKNYIIKIITVYATVDIIIFIFIKIIQNVYGVSYEEMDKKIWYKL